MDVNEKIVIAWLEETKKMFTRNNIDYGQYHSDIDILAINLFDKIAWDCEVKIRTGSIMISDNDTKQNGFKSFSDSFKNTERINVLKTLVPHDYKIEKKFITTLSFLGKTDKNRLKWVTRFSVENIEVIFIEKIINELNMHSTIVKKSTNEVIQTLRLLNILSKNTTNSSLD